MELLIRKSVARRYFFIVLALMFALLVGLRFVIAFASKAKTFDPIVFWAAVTDNLIGTLFVTLAVALLIVYLLPDMSATAHLATLQPREIGALVSEASRETTEWWFKGGQGRYLRSTTLPNLVTSATRGKAVSLNALLFNPLNDTLCAKYAEYRYGLASGADKYLWNADRVKAEIYATIFEIFRASRRIELLSVQVGLLDTMSTFRFDLSSK